MAPSTILLLCALALPVALGSAGDLDPAFRRHVSQCAATGCISGHCIPGCTVAWESKELAAPPNATALAEAAAQRHVASPWPLVVTQWDCLSECKYEAMQTRESERERAGAAPVKYYGKWPFTRVLGLQEPASVLFSYLNLVATLWGLSRFVATVYLTPTKRRKGSRDVSYDYSGIFVVYGVMQMNSWLWSTVFHARDVHITERLDYNSAIALMGLALVAALIRSTGVRLEAARFIMAAPIMSFTATHICYMNFYEFDYGWNIKVCSVLGVAQLLLWTVWAGAVRHPAALKLWATTFGTAAAMLLEIFDFPPVWGLIDAHAAWHAATIPLTLCWWSFLEEDARAQISAKVEKAGKRSMKTENK